LFSFLKTPYFYKTFILDLHLCSLIHYNFLRHSFNFMVTWIAKILNCRVHSIVMLKVPIDWFRTCRVNFIFSNPILFSTNQPNFMTFSSFFNFSPFHYLFISLTYLIFYMLIIKYNILPCKFSYPNPTHKPRCLVHLTLTLTLTK